MKRNVADLSDTCLKIYEINKRWKRRVSHDEQNKQDKIREKDIQDLVQYIKRENEQCENEQCENEDCENEVTCKFVTYPLRFLELIFLVLIMLHFLRKVDFLQYVLQ